MNVVMIVPTGVGAEIGGHAGDANPVAKLLGATCDNLILHPNVVNASDINEMAANAMYVDGYMLDQFFDGERICASKNRNILVAVNSPVTNQTINAVSASRATLGIDIRIVELKTPLIMNGYYDHNGVAGGSVSGVEDLAEQIGEIEFDALAVATSITVDREAALEYLNNGGVNPWGGVEAIASRMISEALGGLRPVAHAPVEDGLLKDFKEVVDPRMAAEMISECFLHSVLKGLAAAPQYDENNGLVIEDIDFLVSPYGCWGPPHEICIKKGIDVILVKENDTVLDRHSMRGTDESILVDNYLTAAGVVMAKRAGIVPSAVRRPLVPTEIIR